MAEKILVVDDDLDTLRLVGIMLERQGYSIVAASNGQQALTLAHAEHPDLILLDLMMPDISGTEVARQLRASADTQDVPIIMFTAKSALDDKLEGYEVGADDYLTKPIQPKELVAHVKAVLGRVKKGRGSASIDIGRERGFVTGITSVRGGMGVSTLALNLGVALYARSKKETLVAELRPGRGTIALELGYLQSQGLNRLLARKVEELDARTVENELMVHSSRVRFLLSSSQPADAKYEYAVGHFDAILKHITRMAYHVVVDLPPSIPPANAKLLPQMDMIYVLLEPLPQTIQQTKLFIEAMVQSGVAEGRVTPVLYNRVRSGSQLSISQVQEQLGHNIPLVFTPAPELAYQASMNNVPMLIVQPDGITAQQFFKVAEKVMERSS